MSISFDLNAYHYGEGIKSIQLMFVAAKTALEQHLDEKYHDTKEYIRRTENGGDPIGQWEDNHKLWDQEDLYRLQLDVTKDALCELRATTIIMLFHLFERSVPVSTDASGSKIPLLKPAEMHAFPTHPDIYALQCASNYLKHGTEIWRQKLISGWRERFDDGNTRLDRETAWLRRLWLDDDDVEWFFQIAKASERPAVRG